MFKLFEIPRVIGAMNDPFCSFIDKLLCDTFSIMRTNISSFGNSFPLLEPMG
ncbi:Uncharacterised protein [Chlamydia trachomatis]|nr:Uncharacterised protein [Chlamydia trachomatis]